MFAVYSVFGPVKLPSIAFNASTVILKEKKKLLIFDKLCSYGIKLFCEIC